MKKQYFLKKTMLFILVLFCGVAGDLKAQTNLITNPGFEDTPSNFTVNISSVNYLMKVLSYTSIATETTQPVASSISVTDGLWVKKQSVSSSSFNSILAASGANSSSTCLFMKVSGGNATAGFDWTKYSTQQRIQLSNSKIYSFSFWAKVSTGVNTAYAYIADKTGNTGSASFYKTISLTGGATWTKYIATFDIPAIRTLNSALDYTTAYVGVGITPGYTVSAPIQTINAFLYVDDFLLSESTTPVISSSTSVTTNLNPIPITITFNNSVTGFTSSDLIVSNGTVSGFSGSGTTYTANITPTSEGAVNINIAAAAAIDGLSNATLAATQFSRTYTAYYRSAASGNWTTASNWESSVDNVNWATATSAPTSLAASVTIQNAHTVNLDANVTITNLILNSGSTFNINAGKQLTVSTTLNNSGTLNLLSENTSGTATILTPATLGGTGGTYNVQQNLTTGRNWYISNPVAAVVPTVVSGTITLNTYDEAGVTDAAGATGWGLTTDALAVGKGYVAAVSADGNITFTGALNTGNKNILVTSRTGTANKAGFNLIGNPYPSYLDWDAVTAANVGKLRSTTMWYRTKMLNEASQLVYQFWTVNGDGIGVPNGASVKIPPMQSFWVRAVEGGGSLAVTNSMRSHAPVTDKLLKAPAAKNVDRTLIRLQVSNGVNSDEAVVYFSANAQNGPDSYDSPKMTNGNNAIPEIYTVVGAEQLVINGMNAIPFNTELPLGFKTGTANNFSIKATEIANLSTDIKVVLKDKLLNIEQDISNGAQYSFTSDEVNSISRFAIVFKSAALINGVAENNDNNFALSVYKNLSNQIIVQNTGAIGQERLIIISNAMGQRLVTEVSTSSNTVIQKSFDPGIYLVTMQLPGKMITKKITIN